MRCWVRGGFDKFNAGKVRGVKPDDSRLLGFDCGNVRKWRFEGARSGVGGGRTWGGFFFFLGFYGKLIFGGGSFFFFPSLFVILYFNCIYG